MKYFSDKNLDKRIKEIASSTGAIYTGGEHIVISDSNVIDIDSETLDDISEGTSAYGAIFQNGLYVAKTLVHTSSQTDDVKGIRGFYFDAQDEITSDKPDLYVRLIGSGPTQQRVLYSPLPLITEGDQIVGDGTPGGGDTPVHYLNDLSDVVIGSNLADGHLIVWDSTARGGLGAWVNVSQSSITPDMSNYYMKSETYSKTEVNNLIGAIDQFHYEIYASTSAVTDPQSNVLYLIGPTGSGADKYEEYVYTNSTWTKIGDTSIDLSGYVQTSDVKTLSLSVGSTLIGTYDPLDSSGTSLTISAQNLYDAIGASKYHPYGGDTQSNTFKIGDATLTWHPESFDGAGDAYLELDSAFLTLGDQIVGSGTPGGGGGGGASYLYQLNDTISSWTGKPSVNATQVLVFDPSAQDKESSTGAWKYVPATDIGRVYSGGTGITINGETISLSSGVATTGTYRSVTVDTYGRVTAGTNPTTLSGYGITDAKFGTAGTDYVPITLGSTTKNVLTAHQSLSGYVPTSRTVNSKALSSDITLSLDDVADGSTRKLANYLPLTGGRLDSGSSRTPLTLNNTNQYGPDLRFQMNGTLCGRVGVGSASIWLATVNSREILLNDDGPHYSPNGSTYYDVYHSGNSNKSDVAWSCSTLNASGTSAVSLYNGSTAAGGLNRDANNQLVLYAQCTGTPQIQLTTDSAPIYRRNGTNYTIYHSGNSNSTSVAWSASSLTLPNAGAIYFRNAANTASWECMKLTASNNLVIGNYVAVSSKDTVIDGYNVRLRYGQGNLDGIYLNSSGNVGIGSNSPYSKVEIAGSFAEPNSTSIASSAMLAVNRHNDDGIFFGFGSTTKGWIQSAYYGTSTTTSALHPYQLCINPLGGNVGVGTTSPTKKLEVNGDFAAYGYIYSYGTYGGFCLYPGLASGESLRIGTLNGSGSWTSNAVFITTTGDVGIGTNSPGTKFEIRGTLTVDAPDYPGIIIKRRGADSSAYGQGIDINVYNNIGANLSANGSGDFFVRTLNGSTRTIVATFAAGGTFTTTGDQVISSDERLKTHIEPVKLTVEQIANMRAVTYDRKDTGLHSLGVIAQDWEKVLPESVNQGEYLTFKYAQTAMVSAIVLAKHETEQDKEIRELKARVKELEKQLEIRS